MAVSNYFNNFEASNEQVLLEDLVIESIRIYGHNVFYLPRTLDNKDEIYGESSISSYNSSHMIEMYIKSIDGFSGDGNFLSKFGLEIRDQIIFSVAQRIFADDIIAYELTEEMTRPREGDLIYFPLNQKCFQVKYVNKFEMFYQLGALQTWEMTCELFEYSSEYMNTGINEIDSLQNHTLDFFNFALRTEDDNFIVDQSNNYIVTEKYMSQPGADSTDDSYEIQVESNTFIDFTQIDPFSEGRI